MQDELIRLFVKDTNHARMCQLPGLSRAAALVSGGAEVGFVFVLNSEKNLGDKGLIKPRLVVTKPPARNSQVFIISNGNDEQVWVYPDQVRIVQNSGTTEIYRIDMFLDPLNPTNEEVEMLRMAKGSELDVLMRGFAKMPGKIIERVMSGRYVSETESNNKFKVIDLIG